MPFYDYWARVVLSFLSGARRVQFYKSKGGRVEHALKTMRISKTKLIAMVQGIQVQKKSVEDVHYIY